MMASIVIAHVQGEKDWCYVMRYARQAVETMMDGQAILVVSLALSILRHDRQQSEREGSSSASNECYRVRVREGKQAAVAAGLYAPCVWCVCVYVFGR